MAKTKISEFSTTAGNNTDINSINIAEGCAPSGINDAIRELMRQLKEFQTGGAGDSVNSGGDFSVATNKFTVASASGNTAVAGTLGVTGAATLSSTLAVTGTTTLTGALVANGNATLGDGSSDTVTVKGTPTLEVNPTFSGGTANGVLYLNGSKVATSGSALVFDGSNLGLGVTPSAWGGTTKNLEGGSGSLNFYSTSQLWLTQNAYWDGAWKYKNNGYATSFQQYNGTYNWYTAPSGTAGNAISFTQALTLDANGFLLLGTTSTNPNAGIAFNSPSTAPNIRMSHANGTSSGTAYMEFNYDQSGCGSITQLGTSAVLYNTSSDYRLKNITGPITNSGAYIDSLNPVEGTWKADGSVFVGLIAHEVQEASRTQVATGVKDGEQMQGMDYSSSEIIANLIAEVKSLRQRVATLEAQ